MCGEKLIGKEGVPFFWVHIKLKFSVIVMLCCVSLPAGYLASFLQMEVSGFMNSVLDKLGSLTEELQDLKKENERLRQLL